MMDSEAKEWASACGKKAFVWTHFLIHKPTGKVKCKACSKEFAWRGSTTGMIYHLQHKHGIKEEPPSHPQEEKPDCNQPTITQVFAKKGQTSLEVAVSRLACVDRIPFVTIAQSVDIQQGLAARGFQGIPRSRQAVKNLVMTHAEQKKS